MRTLCRLPFPIIVSALVKLLESKLSQKRVLAKGAEVVCSSRVHTLKGTGSQLKHLMNYYDINIIELLNQLLIT
jgi:hypothetical protein